MASMKRKQYEAAFKARVALEAVKGEKTISQVASEYGVHPNQVRQWKEHLLRVLPGIFSDRRKRTEEERDELEAELYQQIGQLKVENDWLKKKISAASVEEKRRLVEKDNRKVSVARQCELLDLWKSSYYYNSVTDDDYNLELMGLIDEQYTKAPFYGVRKMTAWLRTRGYEVNPKRVRRLFQRMGFQAIYPREKNGETAPELRLSDTI